MLHPLKPYVDREEPPTCLARELLNITALVMSYAPFDYVLRTTVDTRIEYDWLNNSCWGLFLDG